MFVTQGARAPLLAPETYVSCAWLEAEKSTVFSTGWHLVASRGQLARDGAFIATDLAGLPILVRNEGGSLHAFVNVCAHRHSLLEAPGCGVRRTLRCRYHGWEYDTSGAVSKLPDGASFKGFKSAGFALRKLRVESFGPLVYVSLSEAEPTLLDWLGPLASELSPFYERTLSPLFVRSIELDVNWKVLTENAVESYHVPTVHPATFQYYRPQELHDHRIEPTFTRYADREPWRTTRTGRALDAMAKLLLSKSDGQRFRHAHRFPNQLYYYGDLYCDVSVVTPLGPGRCRHTCFAFLPDALRLPQLTRPVMKLFGALMNQQSRRIFGEDIGVLPGIQAGIAHAQTRGVLSAREERVWAFQRWVAEQTERAGSAGLVTLQGPREPGSARSKER